MRTLLKIIAVVVLLIVIAAVAAFFYIDRLVKAGIEYGATYALGVETTLGDADVGIFRGRSSISQLGIANPDGFESDHFFTLGRGSIEVRLGSLLKDNVEIPKLQFDDIDLYLEKREGKSNYGVILENLGRFEKGDSADQEESKQLVVRELAINNVKVTVDLLPIKGKLTRQEITIPEIKLKDIGSGTGNAVAVADLAGIVLKSVLHAVVEKGVDLPGAVLKELGQGLEGLASVGEFGLEVLGEVGTTALSVAGEAVDVVGEGLGKGVEGAEKAVGGILEGLGETLGKDEE
jgi:hypothetical protein